MVDQLLKLKGLPSMAALAREIGWSKQRLKAASDSEKLNGQLIIDVCLRWPDLAFYPDEGFFERSSWAVDEDEDATKHLPTVEVYGRREIVQKFTHGWVKLWAITRETTDIEMWIEGEVTFLNERFGSSQISFVD